MDQTYQSSRNLTAFYETRITSIWNPSSVREAFPPCSRRQFIGPSALIELNWLASAGPNRNQAKRYVHDSGPGRADAERHTISIKHDPSARCLASQGTGTKRAPSVCLRTEIAEESSTRVRAAGAAWRSGRRIPSTLGMRRCVGGLAGRGGLRGSREA
ncbi:hypothetical protein EV356DRAFT_569616 [Viridothelium virens]|uniref:Uncharacterized protein n=1 Tax=Viridothelium virens TaxID=1048519 RepID=A0A6A6GZQ2_VIRVR|nr:hypothetical protein EV356DRAFT_569616 [Viridothelium virens]